MDGERGSAYWGYRGWQNEWQMNLWGSSGKTLELWMQKYEEYMEERTHMTLLCEESRLGHGGGPEAGLYKLNRQEQRRWLQERMEMMRNT
jgi:hypothetical protein